MLAKIKQEKYLKLCKKKKTEYVTKCVDVLNKSMILCDKPGKFDKLVKIIKNYDQQYSNGVPILGMHHVVYGGILNSRSYIISDSRPHWSAICRFPENIGRFLRNICLGLPPSPMCFYHPNLWRPG